MIGSWDVVVVGSGVAGLMCALSLGNDKKVALVTKKKLEDSNSFLAQGGICVRKGEEDRELFMEDTLKAGGHQNNLEAVSILVDESEAAIETLIHYGVAFKQDDKGYCYTKEGAHQVRRILYCDDQTGRFIMEKLIAAVKKQDNITIFEEVSCQDLLIHQGSCVGIFALKEGVPSFYYAKQTVLATGGLGGIFENTTSFLHIKGEGVALAIKHGVALKDLSYIQIHPTAFYEESKKRRFLISESVRGEGALLKNHKGKRFVDELQARDKVSQAILAEMEKEKVKHEWLDFSPIDGEIEQRFPHIMQTLHKAGIYPEKEKVPVVPAHHYTMGGIHVDMQGRTSLNNLFAVGEVACTGVHGKNRLASNSLLECVVFGKRVGETINQQRQTGPTVFCHDNRHLGLKEKNMKDLIENGVEDDKRHKIRELCDTRSYPCSVKRGYALGRH